MRAFYARRHCLLLTVLALAVVVMMAGCESGTYQAVASSPLYTIITQLKVAPGALNQAEAALATLAAASRQQDGCRTYQLYRCVPDPYGGQNHDFMTYENWTTEADGNAHLASAAFAALQGAHQQFRGAAAGGNHVPGGDGGEREGRQHPGADPCGRGVVRRRRSVSRFAAGLLSRGTSGDERAVFEIRGGDRPSAA